MCTRMKRKQPCAFSDNTYNQLLHDHVFYSFRRYRRVDDNEYKNMKPIRHPDVKLILPNTNTHYVVHDRKDLNKIHDIVMSNKRRRLNVVESENKTNVRNKKKKNKKMTNSRTSLSKEYCHNFYIYPNLRYRLVHQQPLAPNVLKKYQEFYINWLYFCENNYDLHPLYKSAYSIESRVKNNNFCYIYARNGALLAMDTGLGKTIVAFGLVVASIYDQQQFVREKNGYPTLYLCPKRVTQQVYNESKRFYPRRLKLFMCEKTSSLTSESVRNADIVVMSYGLFIYIMKENRKVICAARWYRVIADESHNLRNCDTFSHKSCNRLSTYRWINMTATPMFNSISDIVNQVRLTGINGLKLSIQTNILKANNQDKSEQVRQIVQRCLKDRVSIVSKSDVMYEDPLPIKRHVIHVPMNQNERDCYNYIVQYFRKNKHDKHKHNVFLFMSLISMICTIKSSPKLDFKSYPLPRACIGETNMLYQSTKYKYVKDILLFCRRKKPDAKFIIFHNYKKPLKNLIAYLTHYGVIDNKSADSKHKYTYLESKNNSAFEREVKRFKTDPYTSTVFSTLQLAAEGLNLAMATYMIFLQPWYTDSQMKQGEGRIHRIGQKDKVHIFYLMYKNTLEESIYEISKQKCQELELLKQCFNSILKIN